MGVGPFGSCDVTWPSNEKVFPNPNPKRFEIIRAIQVEEFVVAEIRYPDCVNYEGRKIMVFADITEAQFRAKKTLDPHFSPVVGPVARFEPTNKGWEMAVLISKMASRAKTDKTIHS